MRNLFTPLLLLLLLALPYAAITQTDNTVKLRITDPNGITDETILRMHEAATPQFDWDWDAWKLFSTDPEIPALYSYSAEGYVSAINSIPFPKKDTTVGIWLSAMEISGQYQLDFEFEGAMTTSIRIGIRDMVTGDHYIADGNFSFFFDVVADPINDVERFEIYLSPAITADPYENTATVCNAGATNWNCQLFSASWTALQNISVPGDSTLFAGLDNGDYAVISVDGFGFTDTAWFTIDFTAGGCPGDDVITDETGKNDDFLSADELLQNQVPVIRNQGGEYHLIAGLRAPQHVRVLVYAINGALLHEDELYTGELDYQLPAGSGEPSAKVILAVIGNEEFSFKLIY